MDNKKLGIIGAFVTLGGMALTLIGNWVTEQQMQAMVDEAVNKRLASDEEDEEGP